MIPSYRPHQPLGESVAAYDLVQSQEAVRRVLDEINNIRRRHLSSEVISRDGSYLEIDLTQGVENLVEHGLGEEVRGWRVVDMQGPSIVWRVTSPTTSGYDSAVHLALGCTATVTIRLEVW